MNECVLGEGLPQDDQQMGREEDMGVSPLSPSKKVHHITDEEAAKLDEECLEKFLKINVKHITDGQVCAVNRFGVGAFKNLNAVT